MRNFGFRRPILWTNKKEVIEVKYCQIAFYSGCSNRCSDYCRIPDQRNEVDGNHFKALVRSIWLLARQGFERVELIGGEPLDYPWLAGVVKEGNKLTIPRLVIITTGINEKKLEQIINSADLERWVFCFTLDFPPEKAKKIVGSKSELEGSAKKSIAGWGAFEKYPELLKRGHVTVGSHNLVDLPVLARRIIEAGAFFNFCPIMHASKTDGGVNLPFIFRGKDEHLITLRPEDKTLAEEVAEELIELKRNPSCSPLFLPSEEYIRLLAKCCKEPEEKYPASCGDKMPYLRLGKRVKGKTLEVMICSDFNLENNKGKPMFGLADWIENPDAVESAWRDNANRIICKKCIGCVWSVSLTLPWPKPKSLITA